ncbi:bifunctional epoxide hydrolase 2-like [Pyrus x bretschneideri]|uniref:bifunctional epoxide hydrolase 2-like n=1 Tax=Pyrus x bretschneideri TaxID=225117 RepID=UPI0020300881|nr:bifunctional epoxide hydrolase 2-like [Pyrus x bretschneideri]
MEDYIRSGAVKHFVPDLDIACIAEGSHFVHEQFPDQVNQFMISFLEKHGIPFILTPALPAYLTPALHPERVSGVITLGIPFIQPGPSAIQNHLLPEGLYISRWQEPGWAEADFGSFDVESGIRNVYTFFSRSEIPKASTDQEIMDLFDPATPLPPGFTEEDLEVYASLYEKNGFRFPVQNPYRTIGLEYG